MNDGGEGLSVLVSEVLEQGLRSTVYRGVLTDDRRPVVLKVLRRERFADAQRLERECAIARLIDSPLVVKALGLTTHDGCPALVLEDFGGRSLHRLVGTPMEIGRFLTLAVELARAVGEVHRHGVVHRDIKPHNFVVNAAIGTVKITDFGIASGSGGAAPPAPLGAVEGTFAYMAPEQTGRTNRAVDRRADLYALGVSFYELLTGVRPFDARDPIGWMHCHLARAPRPPAHLAPHVPALLSDLVLKLLMKAPEERYQSAEGLQADLLRCQRALAETGTIPRFRLGEDDVSSELHVPQKLLGRTREVAALVSAFQASVAREASTTVLVSGYSGVGKSSLVRELQAPVTGAQGFFVAGKFEQYARQIPYHAFARAVGELVQQAIAADGEALGSWRTDLGAALGANAGAVSEVFPEVERLVGPQPPAPPLGPAETQNRFLLALRAFLHVFARREHPLVVFLDDLQWADAASLELVEALSQSDGAGALTLVLAYRDNEVGPAHPFALTIERLRQAGAAIHNVEVAPLDPDSLEAMVSSALHCEREPCRELAALIREKTGGNPFFAGEFLRTLHLDGLLRFDPAVRHFRWRQEEIEARGLTDNVVDLMLDRVRGLPAPTQRTLSIAACIGNNFGAELLALVDETTSEQVATALAPAIEGGLVVVRCEPGAAPRLHFRHDRIQEAAAALVASEARPALRLRIGRLLRTGLDAEGLDRELFAVVNHLNAGLALVSEAAERADLAALNLKAGRKARAATAYVEAARHLAVAAALSSADAWAADYEETFALQSELAECEYLSGQLVEAGARFEACVEHARSDLDRARIFYLRVKLLQVAGDYEAATDVALRSFALLGLAAPASDEEAAAAWQAENQKVEAALAGRSPLSLLDAPRMTDATARMLADLLEASGPPLYMVRPALFPWITLKLVSHSLAFGNAEASCYGYAIYGILRAAVLEDVDGGYGFADLAIRLNDRLGDLKLRGCMLHMLGDHVNFWKHPIATDLPILDRGFQACLEGGDLIYSNYIGFQSPWHLYESGASLESVWRLTEKYAAFALQSKHRPVYLTIRLEQQFLLNLKGLTNNPGTFDSGTFDEAAAFREISAARFGCGIVYYHVLKLVSRYTYGDYQGAWASAQAAERDLAAAFSMPMQVSYFLFKALTLAALLRSEQDAGARERYVAEIEACRQMMRRWARACPANFAHKEALIGAALAEATGQLEEAMRSYDEAARLAEVDGFVHLEALARELAARLYLTIGVPSVGLPLLEEAVALCRARGAIGKALQLEALGGAPGERRPRRAASTSTAVTAELGPPRAIDLVPVIKASQSLSGEMVLSQLLSRLMDVVLESVSAERGFLLLVDGDRLRVGAHADLNDPTPVGLEITSAAALALSAVSYVRRTNERVILEDAALPNVFSSDDHIARRRPRSLLCSPVMQQGRLVGIFYLENNLASGVFNAERLAVFDIISAQTAISLENARLYEAAQEAVAVRDEFLSIASHELKTPLTPIKIKLQGLMNVVREGRTAQLPPERLTRLLETVDGQISRLTNLIEGLLDISRIQTGRLVLSREPVHLASLVGGVVERHERELAAAGCAVTIDIADRLTGQWDPLRLEQVLTNLLTNACRYAPRAPVSIGAERSGGLVRLVVRDRGPGLTSEDAARVFERFARGVSGSQVGGLGLGLFITRQIIEAHGGTVALDSAPGRGAAFIIELPMGLAQEPQVA